MTLVATTGVDEDEAGLASGVFNTSQQIGGALGLAVLATLASDKTASFLAGLGGTPSPADQAQGLVEGFQLAFYVAAGLFVVGTMLVGLLLRRSDVALIEAQRRRADDERERQTGHRRCGPRRRLDCVDIATVEETAPPPRCAPTRRATGRGSSRRRPRCSPSAASTSRPRRSPHRAGVGEGTLFRRFPSKQDLIDAVLELKMTSSIELMAECAAEPDPERGLERLFFDLIGSKMKSDQGFLEAAGRRCMTNPAFAPLRARSLELLGVILRRAQEAGVARSDLQPQDVNFLLMSAAAALQHPLEGLRDDLWKRYARVILDGLRPEHPRSSSPAPRRASCSPAASAARTLPVSRRETLTSSPSRRSSVAIRPVRSMVGTPGSACRAGSSRPSAHGTGTSRWKLGRCRPRPRARARARPSARTGPSARRPRPAAPSGCRPT